MVVARRRLSYRRPELVAPLAAEGRDETRQAPHRHRFATNNAPAALAFWQNEISLPFDHTQPIRRGYKQHRHDLCGSILKINQVYEPLPDNPPAGGEYAFAPNWSVKAEYDYIKMFAQQVQLQGTAVGGPFGAGVQINAAAAKITQDLHLVKFGVNYHFNP